MRVSHFIHLLQNLDPDAEVVLPNMDQNDPAYRLAEPFALASHITDDGRNVVAIEDISDDLPEDLEQETAQVLTIPTEPPTR